MGCVSGKPDINDQHPNIFQVSNVNEQGALISRGHLEVIETELVLHQRGKQPTVWPLRSLRKYGFDADIFSFECGRRCQTGQGIYAFQCRRAEQLFNVVQQYIVLSLNEESVVCGLNNTEFAVPVINATSQLSRRSVTQGEGLVNAATAPQSSLNRPASINSKNFCSSIPNNSLVVSTEAANALEHNNNNNNHDTESTSHEELNIPSPNGLESAIISYANVGIVNRHVPLPENYVNMPSENASHLYVNVDTNTNDLSQLNAKELPQTPESTVLPDLDDIKHSYANLDTKELEQLRPILQSSFDRSFSVPPTPNYLATQELNYAELDLDPMKSEASATLSAAECPPVTKKSYATIDFNKTTALSQSINPRMDVEEGSRKTRHNSTISDVTTRHSNSLSD